MTSLASHGIEDNNVREEIKTKTGGKTEALDPPYPERILVIMATMGDLMARPREGLLACLLVTPKVLCINYISSHMGSINNELLPSRLAGSWRVDESMSGNTA